jgi:hypothetical protein
MTTFQQALTAPFVRAKAQTVSRGRADNRRFIIILGAVVLLGAMALLALNSVNTAGAFEIKSLQKQSADLQVQQQQIGERVSKAQSPARLARAAASLGMIPAKDPVFIVVKSNSQASSLIAAGGSDATDTASGARLPR